MLLDLGMPRVNGVEVLHALGDSGLPIIVVTGERGSELPEVVARRAVAVFTKPVPPARILSAVAEAVAQPVA
jgi:CheY-like chemotaxis protein